MDKLTDRLFGLYSVYGKKSLLMSIKRAFTFLIPIFMIGACALTVQNFPILEVRQFIKSAFGGRINDFLDIVYNATYGFAAVYLVIAVSYYESVSRTRHSDVRVLSTISSVACYFAFLGADVFRNDALMQYTKMANVFSALLISIAATRLFFAFSRLFRVRKVEYSSAFLRGIQSFLPMAASLLIFAVVAELISLIPGIGNFNDLMIWAINKPFESIGATYIGGLIVMVLESVLWLVGIHGGNVFDPLLNSDTTAFAFANGQIVTKPFLDTFVLMGGCGTTVCLLIALLIFSRDKKKRNLCRLSGVPLIFNINEILVFGMPVVLNPIYIVPFILTPAVSYTIAYLATSAGLVPQVINPGVQWTTPILVSGYQATGSLAGAALQLVILAVGVCIYAPFVRLDDRVAKSSEAKCLDRLTEVCRECEAEGKPYKLVGDNIAFRSFEDDVAAKLSSDIANDAIYLQYQPQVKDGRVTAAEALLRFSYDGSQFIYPPLVVGIATNNGLFDPLSRAIVRRALTDLKAAQQQSPQFKIAVNLRLDLLTDDSFRHWLISAVTAAQVEPNTFGIEITEDATLTDSANFSKIFDEIRRAGIEILMDDFSMGHTSISILQQNYFDFIKIDGSLIRQLSNERSKRIVSSIVQLSKELHFGVIAEYVETEEQRDALLQMGCRVFQGYLYYKDMPIDQLVEVLKEDETRE